MVQLVLGAEAVRRLPHPSSDPGGYIKGLDDILAHTPTVFDPSVEKQVPWVNTKTFATKALGLKSSCVIS